MSYRRLTKSHRGRKKGDVFKTSGGTESLTAKSKRVLRGNYLKRFFEVGSFISLDFKVRLTDLPRVKDALRGLGPVNNFYPEKVIQAINRFHGEVSSFSVGQESTPVMYVHLPYWTHQQLKNKKKFGGGTKLSDVELRKIRSKVLSALKTANPDELSYSKQMNRIRVWWD